MYFAVVRAAAAGLEGRAEYEGRLITSAGDDVEISGSLSDPLPGRLLCVSRCYASCLAYVRFKALAISIIVTLAYTRLHCRPTIIMHNLVYPLE